MTAILLLKFQGLEIKPHIFLFFFLLNSIIYIISQV